MFFFRLHSSRGARRLLTTGSHFRPRGPKSVVALKWGDIVRGENTALLTQHLHPPLCLVDVLASICAQ